MGIGKRLVDLAKANLNALLDKAGGEGGVDELSDEELEAELRRRRERRDREQEERRAAERAAEAARQRLDARAAAAAKARNEARAAEAKRTTAPPPRREEKRRVPPPGPPIGDKRLRELYSQLEVPYGAPFEDVKKSFRRLMRKYHPDLHAGNPQKQKTATQLTMSLTQAYNELEQHLTGGRRG
ncbi:MAG TPA: J domain-containing protein [Polyangia bacterium]|nr:J domain-containing protein [Polyangia bacterium]